MIESQAREIERLTRENAKLKNKIFGTNNDVDSKVCVLLPGNSLIKILDFRDPTVEPVKNHTTLSALSIVHPGNLLFSGQTNQRILLI